MKWIIFASLLLGIFLIGCCKPCGGMISLAELDYYTAATEELEKNVQTVRIEKDEPKF